MRNYPVIHTKISPPPTSPRVLQRQRVVDNLLQSLDYRLTMVQASAGYGKSTALASLSKTNIPVIWYQITEEDADLYVFLMHLLVATQIALPEIESLPMALLENWDSNQGPLPSSEIIHRYVNELNEYLTGPVILVLDDFHLIQEIHDVAITCDRLISLAPADLKVILSSRVPVKLPNLARLQAAGDTLLIDQHSLSFTSDEIHTLFSDYYRYELSPSEVNLISHHTEGWAIALHLIWQSLRSEAIISIEETFNQENYSLSNLFEVLTHEVLNQQPADVREFLIITAVLRSITADVCNTLLSSTDCAAMLAYLRRQELFLIDAGDGALRYHNIFRHFLLGQSTPEELKKWHKRSAEYYQAKKNFDEGIYHTLQAQEYELAASLLAEHGGQLLSRGRLDSLETSLAALPADTLKRFPELLIYMGDLARFHSRFQEALGWYQQAEAFWRDKNYTEGIARALRGQARVYLDTVNPSAAAELLQQALKLSDGIVNREVNARLYELLAENKLNSGKPDEAEDLQKKADSLRSEGPSESQLLYRVLLRTGRIGEARLKLEEQAAMERKEPVHTPRAHRETQLILSLIHSFEGHPEKALQTAIEGTRRGEELGSPFVTAVGYMRQGHALQLLSGSENIAKARQMFETAIKISEDLYTARLNVEALWGLCRGAGYQGHIQEAEKYAQEGIQLALKAGDEWIASLVRLAIGASLVISRRFEVAENWLWQAHKGFQECSDPFGETASILWRSVLEYRQGLEERYTQTIDKLLTLSQEHEYDFLFLRPTLLGLPDERLIVPLLISAREHSINPVYANQLLSKMGLGDIHLHPGYQLKIFTLGKFEVWRGDQVIPTNGWRREKSRQLFQLLVTYRHAPLDLEQIYEFLWPGEEPAKARRNFKVALNTLYHVLEPERTAGSESAHIFRQGSIYAIRPEADIWIDAETFASQIDSADAVPDREVETKINILEDALKLEQGEYLPDARYETWAAAEREHLSVLFLRAADQLCHLYLQANKPQNVLDLCQRILLQDNCWERAYRYQMLAYERLGDHGQIARVYQKCVQVLKDELDVTPAPETLTLFRNLTSAE